MTDTESTERMTSCAGNALRGTTKVPGDKSISHRAIILGALTVGETRVDGLLEGEDVLATIRAARQFGAEVERVAPGSWRVHGVGTSGFDEPDNVIDCGNSGTGARLLLGAMATTPIKAIFTGDDSLRSRPMRRVLDPLSRFGAKWSGRDDGYLPITIEGAGEPMPVRHVMTAPSAQVKSAVLLAGLNATGRTVVVESAATRDHTERMLKAFGARISVEETEVGKEIELHGCPELVPQCLVVPGDPSSAAFPLAAALIAEGSELRVEGIGMNPTRTGFITTLQEMGASISIVNERQEGGEPTADIVVRSSELRGVEVPPDRAPTMIDEYPILAAVAATANGPTAMRGVGELRIKESDRIEAISEGLIACGVKVDQSEDEFTVHGMGPGNVPGNATCQARLDHRIAMSLLCLGLGTAGPVTVEGTATIRTSFPSFHETMTSLGADIRIVGR